MHWLIDWYIDFLIGWLIDQSINCLINWYIYLLIAWLTDWLTDWRLHVGRDHDCWLTDRPTDRLISSLIDWSIDRSINWLTKGYTLGEMPPLIPASLWTRSDMKEFKDSVRKNPENMIRVGSLSTATVSSLLPSLFYSTPSNLSDTRWPCLICPSPDDTVKARCLTRQGTRLSLSIYCHLIGASQQAQRVKLWPITWRFDSQHGCRKRTQTVRSILSCVWCFCIVSELLV